MKGRLSLYLDRDWENDFLVEVLDDFENPLVVANDAEIPEVIFIESDSEVEENGEEEINGSDSEEANTIVISSDQKVSNNENSSISEEEGND